MSNIKKERLYVYPEFKKKLKMKAAEQGLSVMELTKKYGEDETSLEVLQKEFTEKWRRKRKYDFF